MALITTTNNAALSVPVLQDAIQGAIAGRKLLFGTGAWIFRPGLPTVQMSGLPMAAGITVTVPYFSHLGRWDSVAEGTALIPRAVTSAGENATVARAGIAFEASALSIMVGQAADPYAEAGRQAGDGAVMKFDDEAIAKALLVGSSNAAMVNDLSGGNASYPVLLFKRNAGVTWYTAPTLKADSDILADTELSAMNVYHATHLYSRLQGGQSTRPGVALLKTLLTGANAFSENTVIDTQGLFGDEVSSNDPIVMIAMHSAVATYARKLAYSTGEKVYKFGDRGSANGIAPDTFCGIPVFVSDRLVAA